MPTSALVLLARFRHSVRALNTAIERGAAASGLTVQQQAFLLSLAARDRDGVQLADVRAALELDSVTPADTASRKARAAFVAARVDAYLGKIVVNPQRVVPVPAALADLLGQRESWRGCSGRRPRAPGGRARDAAAARERGRELFGALLPHRTRRCRAHACDEIRDVLPADGVRIEPERVQLAREELLRRGADILLRDVEHRLGEGVHSSPPDASSESA